MKSSVHLSTSLKRWERSHLSESGRSARVRTFAVIGKDRRKTSNVQPSSASYGGQAAQRPTSNWGVGRLPFQVLHCRMARNPPHGFTKQSEAGRNAMPGRTAGGMRQRDQVEGAVFI